MQPIEPIELSEITCARERIADLAIHTPLLPLNDEDAPASIHLKLENLQPIGSFKLRGAGNAMRSMDSSELRDGVFTASAGNMAQGVAYVAQRMGVDSGVVVPDHAPQTKLDAARRMGATIVKVSFDEWWGILQSHRFSGLPGTFIHPVSDPMVIAGNGTIGLEILEDLEDVDAIVVPFGGGGLSCGIACAAKALRPGIKVFAAEVETAAPLAASLEAGVPRAVDYTPSFVDGIGGKSVLEEMWPLAQRMLDGSLVVSLEQVAQSIRLLSQRHRVIAEGAGAASLAAARAGLAGDGRVVCVISGGNIDVSQLIPILGSGRE